MIKAFLKAKHWQLFLLIVMVPLISFLGIVGLIYLNFNGLETDFLKLLNFSKLFYLIILIPFLIYFAWIWAVAMGLQNKVSQSLKEDTLLFKVTYFVPLFYIPILFLLVVVPFYLMFTLPSQITPENVMHFLDFLESTEYSKTSVFLMKVAASAISYIVPIHFFSMFSGVYVPYFTAKTLKKATLKKAVTFSDFANEFLMILFYPIGIWFLQPKINKLIHVKEDFKEIEEKVMNTEVVEETALKVNTEEVELIENKEEEIDKEDPRRFMPKY